MRPIEAARTAREQLRELTGERPEGISAVSRDGDGNWLVTLEVLELKRVPDTMDILASYEVELSDDGELVAFHRRRRYHRAAEEDGG